MTIKQIVIIIFFALPINLRTALALPLRPFTALLYYENANGVKTGYFLEDAAIKLTPEWQPKQEVELPLTPENAILLGVAAVAKLNPKYENFSLVSMSFNRISHDVFKNRWFYSLYFIALGRGESYPLPEGKGRILITLDGNIVPYGVLPIGL